MELVIIQQNVRGRDIYKGSWSIQEYEELIRTLKQKEPDVIYLTEFYYESMYDTTKKILEEYEFIKPLSLTKDEVKQKGLYAGCILAVKQGKVTKGRQIKLENMLDLRYICVDLNIKNGEKIKTLLMYVPQTCNASKERIESKSNMLESAYNYIIQNLDGLLVVGGDMNSDIDGKTTTCINEFEKIYKKMIDTDSQKQPTWKGKRLDYALVSGVMNLSAKTVPFITQSDHKGLCSVIKGNVDRFV